MIVMYHKFCRGSGVLIESFTDLLILVLQNQEDKLGHPFKTEPLFSRVLSYSKRRARSLTTCSVDLSPGSYTLACFSFGKLQQGQWAKLNKIVLRISLVHAYIQ